MKSYLIVADGDFLSREIILEAAKDKVIFALDGAANRLYQRQIMPQIILGDLDGIGEATKDLWGITALFSDLSDDEKPYQGNFNIKIIPCKDQNKTDLIKAINYCDAQACVSIDIVCATGGRMDQHEGVMRALRKEYQSQRLIQIHTEQQTIRFAKNETVKFSGEVGDKCGILAYPAASLSSQGLVYDVTNYQLEFAVSDSTCNSMRLTTASVTVDGEALLVMPGQLKAQREFMQLSEVARLKKLLIDISHH